MAGVGYNNAWKLVVSGLVLFSSDTIPTRLHRLRNRHRWSLRLVRSLDQGGTGSLEPHKVYSLQSRGERMDSPGRRSK